MDYWMFRPLAGFMQSLEWKTDVIRSKASEQRIALRALPRVQYSFKHKLDRKEYQVAKSLMLSSYEFYVPDWAIRYTVTPSIGTAIVLNIGSHPFYVGQDVVFWRSSEDFEICTVSAVTSTSITVDVLESDSESILMSVHQATMSGGLSSSVSDSGFSDIQVSADLLKPIDYGSYSGSIFASHHIYPFQCIIENSLSEKIIWQTEEIDSGLGIVETFKERTYADSIFSLRSMPYDTQSLTMARWLQSRLGKQKAFVVSSGYDDFPIAASAFSGSNYIRVFGIHKTLDCDYIQVTLPNGDKQNYTITGLIEGPTIDGLHTTDITLSTSIVTTLLTSQNIKISKLYIARHDVDRIEIIHGTNNANYIGVSIPCLALS